MLNVKKLLTQLCKANQVTNLSASYTTNSYVSSTEFARCEYRQYGYLLIANIQFQVSSMPKSTAFTTIGKITLPKGLRVAIREEVPTTSGGEVLVTIGTDGTIQIYNYHSTAAGGWVRFTGVGILSGGVL